MRASECSRFGLALLMAALVATVEVNATEVTATLLTIVASAGLLGLVQPRNFWLYTIPIGSAGPVAYATCALLRIQPRSWPEPGGALCYAAIELVTMTVALIAGRAGVAIANATRNARE